MYFKISKLFRANPKKMCYTESVDKASRVQPFRKRNVSPFGLSHHLKYVSISAFFDLPDEKIFSSPIEDFRQTARMSDVAPDRNMPTHGKRRGINPITEQSCRKNDGTLISLSKG